MSKSIYFPGLNGLRFIAASLVIFHHVEQYKHWAGLSNVWGNPVINSLGHMSVSFFFVLSGFLITYLLLAENKRNGSINLKKFYFRRILRIWPLYFVIVALALVGFSIFSQFGFDGLDASFGFVEVACLLFFVPNLLRIINPMMIGANQLWSVGIEEQFYAIWPVLIALFSKRIFSFLIGFVGVKLAVHIALVYVGIPMHESVEKIARLYELFPVEQMAVGGLGGALIFYMKERLLKIFRSPVALLMSIVALGIFGFYDLHGIYVSYVEAVFFTVVLLNVVHYRWLYQHLENKLFIHLGNISYGIYMWHTLVVALLITLIKVSGTEINFAVNLMLHGFSFLITLVIAHISFKHLETPFLKLKNKFSFDSINIKKSKVVSA